MHLADPAPLDLFHQGITDRPIKNTLVDQGFVVGLGDVEGLIGRGTGLGFEKGKVTQHPDKIDSKEHFLSKVFLDQGAQCVQQQLAKWVVHRQGDGLLHTSLYAKTQKGGTGWPRLF